MAGTDRPLSELASVPAITRRETAGIHRVMFMVNDPTPGHTRIRLLQDNDRAELRPFDYFVETEQLIEAMNDHANRP